MLSWHFCLEPHPVPCYYEHLQGELSSPSHGPLGVWWPYVCTNRIEFQLTGGDNSQLQQHGSHTADRGASYALLIFQATCIINLFANQKCYLLLHYVLQQQDLTLYERLNLRCERKAVGVEQFSHLHLQSFVFLLHLITLSLSPYQQLPIATDTSRDLCYTIVETCVAQD